MKVSLKFNPFLSGNKTDSSLEFRLNFEQDDYELYSKISLFTKLCEGKSNLHVGCVDHSLQRMIDKIKKNEWLHEQLVNVSSKTVGIDIIGDGIRYIKDNFSYDVKEASVYDYAKIIEERNFYYLLLPDVLEHMYNPVYYLSEIRKLYQHKAEKIIITVPNALFRKNFSNARGGVEIINSDHNYWFTHYSLCKVVTMSGFIVENLYMMDDIADKKSYKVKNMLYKNRFLRAVFLERNILLFNRIGIVAKFPEVLK